MKEEPKLMGLRTLTLIGWGWIYSTNEHATPIPKCVENGRGAKALKGHSTRILKN